MTKYAVAGLLLTLGHHDEGPYAACGERLDAGVTREATISHDIGRCLLTPATTEG